jgi:hypothetical protein
MRLPTPDAQGNYPEKNAEPLPRETRLTGPVRRGVMGRCSDDCDERRDWTWGWP